MKTKIILIQFCLSFFCKGQNFSEKFIYSGENNFNSIKTEAESFFSNKTFETKDGKNEDNDYYRFKRWEWYWKNRVLADGSFPDLTLQSTIYKNLQSNSKLKTNSVASPWVNISQTSTTSGYNGMGRITAIAFHPTNANIFWIGAPIGGIWKTTDGGLTYAPLGESLPYCSVGSILVDPINPNVIYITIGDNSGWWTYGLGVYKSTDGGANWAPTSLVSNFSANVAYYAMAMSPKNPNVILVAASNGLFRTNNAGLTWTNVHSGSHNDVTFKPNDSTVVYSATDDYWGSSEVFKSTNGGITHSQISSFATSQQSIKLTVTPANDNVLGMLVSGTTEKYYNSINSGAIINFISSPPQGSMVIISPTNANKVYSGFMNIYKSVSAGAAWSQLTNWYNNGTHQEVHADQRYAAFNPLNNKIYFCNDGGLYSFNELGSVWADLSNGLIITQFYSISVSQTDPVFMIGGTQDNGGRKRIGINSWDATNGGDAMETAIDESFDQIIYTTYIFGQLYRSDDQWTLNTYADITPVGAVGDWVTPYVLDPNDQSTIIAGYEDVYKSTDQGSTWNKISTNLTGSVNNKLSQIEVAPSNSSVIYTTRNHTIYSTINGGANWTPRNVPCTNEITSIAIHPQNSSILYVTVGGYAAGGKVFKTLNNGTTWTNVSGTLPNVPVSASIYDKNSSNHDLYIGTDVGVFYINDLTTTWTYYGTNLPNTSVTDLKIQYPTGKLRCATHGRGIWEIDLNSTTSIKEQDYKTKNQNNNFTIAFNPIGSTLFLNSTINKEANCQIKICDVSGKLVYNEQKYFPQGNYQIPIDVSFLNTGVFFMTIHSETEKSILKIIKLE